MGNISTAPTPAIRSESAGAEPPLIDPFDRPITYLRVSLTDACNFRCIYCVPPDGYAAHPARGQLTRAEIVRFVQLLRRLGINRVRLTGGEPLLRGDVVEIVRELKTVAGVEELSITTNASRLAGLVGPLKEAGLDRINISLDSTDAARFREVTGVDCYPKVFDATFRALEAGFPVKLNMVVLRGLTEAEIIRFVQLACDFPLEVRFLEFMPLCGQSWEENRFLPITSVRHTVQTHFALTEAARADRVAQTFGLVEGRGRVGFIASLTESFCDQCSRIRLTADGRIRPCLFSNAEVSVGHLLRQHAPDREILAAVRFAAAIKPRGNWFRDHPLNQAEPSQPDFAGNPLIHSLGG